MANDARRVGSKFETDVMSFLRGRNIACERLAKAGSLDEGDLVIPVAGGAGFVFELKARRDRNSSLNLGSWLQEAHRESQHYATARGIQPPQSLLVVKNPGKSIGKAFVVQELEDWINEHTG